MSEIAPFSLVANDPAPTTTTSNEDVALAVDKLSGLLFAANHIMQDYAVNSPEHRAVCTIMGEMEEPLNVIKEYCAAEKFPGLPLQQNPG